MSIVLDIHDLKKSFGSHKVIDNLSLAVPEHSIFGFIGPNGAGKTTTMKMVLGLLKPDSGSITVCGEHVSYGETKTNRFVGYLPDVPEFYGYMKPLEYLHLCGSITGMSRAQITSRSQELLTLVGLDDVKRKISGFSRGMKQRLGIAQALLNEPRLLICDEPTSALDPVGRKEILDILSAVKGKTTVLFSTHVLSDVERICDRIAVVNKGKIVMNGPLSIIKERHAQSGFVIEFADEQSLLVFSQALEKQHEKVNLSSEGVVLTVTCSAKRGQGANEAQAELRAKDPQRNEKQVSVAAEGTAVDGLSLIKLLSDLEIAPLRFEESEPDLEDLFMEAIA